MGLLEKLLGKAGPGTLDPGAYADPDPRRSAVTRQAAATVPHGPASPEGRGGVAPPSAPGPAPRRSGVDGGRGLRCLVLGEAHAPQPHAFAAWSYQSGTVYPGPQDLSANSTDSSENPYLSRSSLSIASERGYCDRYLTPHVCA